MASSLPRQNSCCNTPASTTVVTYGGVTEGHGEPSAPPDNLTISWVYKDLDTSILWFWSVESQAWG